MKRTFAYGAATNQGGWHVQEDGFFADPADGVFALADGFGGRGAGDMAAKLALDEVRNAPATDPAPREGGLLSPAQAAHRDLFGEINKKLLQWNEKRASSLKGGCSLLLARVEREQRVTVTAVGAVGAILVRGGNWLPLLAPQSAPRSEPNAPLFASQALGVGRELNPESRSFLWQPNDLLLLFSGGVAWERDGLVSNLNAELALRTSGSDLAAFVQSAVSAEEAPWNRTLLAVEALS
jgi:serine/threonine protein phosphatase PrpC